MLQYYMEIFSKIFNVLNPFAFKGNVYSSGPNNLEELLKQFDIPSKEKTDKDIIRDYQIKETMAALEVDMLKMDKSLEYKGTQIWFEGDVKCFDFVPCVLRPEVLYCSYGKN